MLKWRLESCESHLEISVEALLPLHSAGTGKVNHGIPPCDVTLNMGTLAPE